MLLEPHAWQIATNDLGYCREDDESECREKRRCSAVASCPRCWTSRSLRVVLLAATLIALAGVAFEERRSVVSQAQIQRR